jgi:hypothetical protein
MKDPNVITPALSDEEVMEMNQLEYVRKLNMEENEEGLTEADYWDGDDSACE